VSKGWHHRGVQGFENLFLGRYHFWTAKRNQTFVLKGCIIVYHAKLNQANEQNKVLIFWFAYPFILLTINSVEHNWMFHKQHRILAYSHSLSIT
jgi:hypothetical protein